MPSAHRKIARLIFGRTRLIVVGILTCVGYWATISYVARAVDVRSRPSQVLFLSIGIALPFVFALAASYWALMEVHARLEKERAARDTVSIRSFSIDGFSFGYEQDPSVSEPTLVPMLTAKTKFEVINPSDQVLDLVVHGASFNFDGENGPVSHIANFLWGTWNGGRIDGDMSRAQLRVNGRSRNLGTCEIKALSWSLLGKTIDFAVSVDFELVGQGFEIKEEGVFDRVRLYRFEDRPTEDP